MTDLPKRYLRSGAATNVHIHSVHSLGTEPNAYGDQVENFEVWEHGGPINYAAPQGKTNRMGAFIPKWRVESAMGWLHVYGPEDETHQTFDGIARRVRPDYKYIGEIQSLGRRVRAYTLYPAKTCGGETGSHDDRCGRTYGHAGPCDWCD